MLYSENVIGNYVKWFGLLARIEDESIGMALINVKDRGYIRVALSSLKPINLQVVRNEHELSRIGESSNGKGSRL